MSNTNAVVQLSAARIARLADKAGDLQTMIDSLSRELTSIKDELKDGGMPIYYGKRYKVIVTRTERTVLDQKLVKGILTPAEIEQCSVTGVITSAAVKIL